MCTVAAWCFLARQPGQDEAYASRSPLELSTNPHETDKETQETRPPRRLASDQESTPRASIPKDGRRVGGMLRGIKQARSRRCFAGWLFGCERVSRRGGFAQSGCRWLQAKSLAVSGMWGRGTEQRTTHMRGRFERRRTTTRGRGKDPEWHYLKPSRVGAFFLACEDAHGGGGCWWWWCSSRQTWARPIQGQASLGESRTTLPF